MNTKSLLHCCLFVLLTVLPIKQVFSGNEEPKVERIMAANEEHIDEEFSYFGGDIILTDLQKKMLEGKEYEVEVDGATDKVSNKGAHNLNRRAVVKDGAYLWPNGVVPYVLDSTLSSSAVNAIRAAMSEYEKKTCIRFVKRTSQSDYVRFLKDKGCYSYLGRTGAAGQIISIGRGCEYKGIVIHEIFHALGRWHEQSRPDRDYYIKINYENIRRDTTGNFKKVGTNAATTQGIKYDLQSIMHYDAYAFSTNGRPTIEPRNSGIKLNSVGQRRGFTNLDLQHVNTLYNCQNQPSGGLGSWAPWSTWSSCSVTCGDGIKERTRSCDGSRCTGQSRQTKSCTTNSCPAQNTIWGQWESWSSCSLTCGRGRRTRTRTCETEGTATCSGASSQIQYCNTQACTTTTTSNGWGPWSPWTPCASKCGGGLTFRSRRCLSYTYAGCRSGKSYQLKSCGSWQCSPASDPEYDSGKNTQLYKTDAKHISCQALNFQENQIVLSLRSIVSAIFSGPFQAREAKDMCINLAKSMNYTYIGIMGGYCISIHELKDHLDLDSGQVNDKCMDGIGKYDPSSSTQYMDVYRIPITSSQELLSGDNLQSLQSGISGASITMGYTVSYSIAVLISVTLY